jgi:hypothetical protein
VAHAQLPVGIGAHAEDSAEDAEHQAVAASAADLGDMLVAQEQAGIFNPHEWSLNLFDNYRLLRFLLGLLLLFVAIHFSPSSNISIPIAHDCCISK